MAVPLAPATRRKSLARPSTTMLPRAIPLDSQSSARPHHGPIPRGVFVLLFAFMACVLLALSIQGPAPQSTRPQSTLAMPNFDFDLFRGTASAPLPEAQTDEEDLEGPGDGGEEETEDLAEDVEDADLHLLLSPSHSSTTSSSIPLPRPFLPWQCSSSCPDYVPGIVQPTCAKYTGPDAPNATYDPLIFERSVLFPGTGSEVRRVLSRAVKTHLYGKQRRREGAATQTAAFEDEQPFQILVLGGSVSNCRGVDPWTECWHSRVEDWFHRILPLEGDPITTMAAVDGPQRLNTATALRVETPSRLAGEDSKRRGKRDLVPTIAGKANASKGKPKKKSKKKKKKRPSTAPGGRKRPLNRIINAAKSATGSAFYAYCFEAEMAVRGKNRGWGKGPDLVVLEFGVNDVWPTTEVATRDFERLLFHLRSLPSAPAIIILEAASLLLAQTLPAHTSAEYLHLAPAHFHDVPILSTKHPLFGPTSAILPNSNLSISDLFLPDLHHFNARGHELLADTLTSYLERELCAVQSQVLRAAGERVLNSPEGTRLVIDPRLDFPSRKLEAVLPRPERSLFAPFGGPQGNEPFDLPAPTCLQISNAKSTVTPTKNVGWAKYSWSRDKQYLMADKPGSTVTFDVVVGSGGEVLVDWLRSRFYDLGNVLVYMDGQKTKGVVLEGWWDLGWSIGVPTIAFSDLAAGSHQVTFELLSAALSSHPAKKTGFRLIGLITT